MNTDRNSVTSAINGSETLTPDAATTTAPLAPVPGESDRAFDAFRIYVELGPRRRYIAVSRKTAVPLRTIERWAHAYDWRNRARAYAAQCADDFATAENIGREHAADITAHTESMRQRQLALVQGLYDTADRYLQWLENEDVDQIRFSDVCRAIHMASLLSRHAENANLVEAAEKEVIDEPKFAHPSEPAQDLSVTQL